MRNFLKVISAALVGAGLFALPALAQAQEVTLRVEPGVAVPLTEPQSSRFGVGAAVAIKPELGLGSYFSVGPSLSYMALPSRIDGTDTGTALGLGGFARLKRPHDYLHNPATGFKAVSPWIDGDAGYVRTDPLDRFNWSVAVGASVPTSDSRWLWVGPFARFNDIHETYDKAATDTRNAKTLILGLSFELGAPHKRPAPAAPPPVQPPPPPPVQPPPPPVTPPPVVHQDVDIEARAVVQFAWDSPVLDSTATAQLNEVVKKLTSAKNFKAIRIEGHASSEGQVKHNDVLAQNRANSVLEFLAAHGVPREKLSAVGFGSRNPVATNKTEAGRVLNRRAEFVVNFVIVKEVK
jgi:outer membrane protein OmpA-like peptidoglycan-associated protein